MGELRLTIPDELHKRLKQMALEQNTTLKRVIIGILKKGVKPEAQKRGEE